VAGAFVQSLGSNQSKTAGTSLAISVASLTITVGNKIFVGYSGDNAGSAFGVTDNLGNTYTQDKEQIQTTGGVKTQLWVAPVTVGGTLTAITIAWTTNVTAKALAAAEFSGIGTRDLTDGANGTNNLCGALVSQAFQTGDLLIGAFGVEDDVAPAVNGLNGAGTVDGSISNGTSGGSSTSNISVTLGYQFATNPDATVTWNGALSGTQNSAGAGAIYSAAVTSFPLLDDSDDCAFLIVDY
jgi:hypothetical protein